MNNDIRLQTFEGSLLHGDDTAAVPLAISLSLFTFVFCSLIVASTGVRTDRERDAERKSRIKNTFAVVRAGLWPTAAFPTSTFHVVAILSILLGELALFPV